MADDLDDLLTEVDIRAPDDSGTWSGDFSLHIPDTDLVRGLTAAVRDLQAEVDTLRRARELNATLGGLVVGDQEWWDTLSKLTDLLVDGGGDG